MKKIILLVLGIFFLSFIAAAPSFYVTQNTPFDIKVSCENQGGFCSGAATCKLTVSYPNSTVLVDNQNMTNLLNGYFNYTLTPAQTLLIGEYSARTGCDDGNASATTTFTYEVNPTGAEARSVFENPIIIILIILAFIFIGMGIYFTNPSLGFMGSIILLLSGIYTMIYGFNNITNLYTQGAGISLIGLAIIFLFVSAYEWLGWGTREE